MNCKNIVVTSVCLFLTGAMVLYAQTEVPVISPLNEKINVVFTALSGTFARSIAALAIVIAVILAYIQRINWMLAIKIIILTLIVSGIVEIVAFVSNT